MGAAITQESRVEPRFAMMLRLNTLGRLYVERDSIRLGGAAAQPRRLALLALLAAASHRGASRDQILSLLWADTDEDRARKALNQAIYALRQELGSEEAIAGGREMRLEPQFISADVVRFGDAIARGDLESAVAEYGGPFLDGFHLPNASEFERWVETRRSGFARDHATALERLARRAAEHGDDIKAVDWWRRRAAHDPLDAGITMRLMEALVRAGDSAGALQHARIHEVLIAQELELPPDRAVLELAARIRREVAAESITAETTAEEPATATGATAISPRAPALSVEETVLTPAAEISGDASRAPNATTPAPAWPEAVGAPPARAVTSADTVAGTAIGEQPIGESGNRDTGKAAARWRRTALLVAGSVVAAAVIALLLVAADRTRDATAVELGPTRRVTLDPGLDVDPALSPDGRVLAYAAGPEGQMRLFVRQLDGSRAIPVTGDTPGDHRRPRWSPDGTRLLFQAARGVWIVPALGGAARPVVEPPPDAAVRALYPAWSPDGLRVAWVQRDTVYTRGLEGGEPKPLAVLPEVHSLAWSPDARWIAAVSRNEAFIYGATVMDVGFTSIGNVAPSAVWLIPAAGGAPARVTDDTRLHTSPEWLGEDGRRLLVVSNREGSRDLFVIRIGSDGRPSGDPRRLTTGLALHTVSASRDGRTLAYSSLGQASNIWAIPIPRSGPVTTTGATQVTRGAQVIEGFDVTADGRWLAFDGDRGGDQNIFRVSTDGGEPEPVVEDDADDFRPSWAPDGRSLVYYSYRNGIRRAFIASAIGGIPRPLLPNDTGEQHSPIWSPDGRRITYHRTLPSGDEIFETLRQADSSWSTPRQLTQRGGWGGRWSPDGTRLAYLAPAQLRVIGAEGEARMRVRFDARDSVTGYSTPVAVRWASDGSTLYVKAFDRRGQASIWAVGVETGTPRLLVSFDQSPHQARRPELATDGQRFFFTLTKSESDLWVVGLDR